MRVSEVLDRAGDLVERGWTQLYSARDESGMRVSALEAEARSWCAVGAVRRVLDSEAAAYSAWDALARVIGTKEIADWNDNPCRTQAEVVAAFRHAAELARSEGN